MPSLRARTATATISARFPQSRTERGLCFVWMRSRVWARSLARLARRRRYLELLRLRTAARAERGALRRRHAKLSRHRGARCIACGSRGSGRRADRRTRLGVDRSSGEWPCVARRAERYAAGRRHLFGHRNVFARGPRLGRTRSGARGAQLRDDVPAQRRACLTARLQYGGRNRRVSRGAAITW